VSMNDRRRHLTPETRKALATTFRKAGQSYRSIAEKLGTSKDTIQRDCGAATVSNETVQPKTITGKDGKKRPATRKTPAAKTSASKTPTTGG
jgi:IS30 family transposase